MKACNDKYLTKGLVILKDLVILSMLLLLPMFTFTEYKAEHIHRNLTLKHISNNY